MSRRLFVLLVLALVPAAVLAASAQDVIRASLAKAMPGVKLDSITASPVAGLYEVVLDGGETAFVSADGNYLISGDLYKAGPKGLVNVSEQRKGGLRRDALAKVAARDMVVFRAEGKERGRVFVFTDVDCGYCRKFHQEVPALNKSGITVNYLAFPRAGTKGPTFDQMQGVWCAADRKEAISQAKRGEKLGAAPVACVSPVADQYRLGAALGVRGTPAIFLANGEQVGGYLPAAELTGMVLKP